jgi:hypothetical protein
MHHTRSATLRTAGWLAPGALAGAAPAGAQTFDPARIAAAIESRIASTIDGGRVADMCVLIGDGRVTHVRVDGGTTIGTAARQAPAAGAQ